MLAEPVAWRHRDDDHEPWLLVYDKPREGLWAQVEALYPEPTIAHLAEALSKLSNEVMASLPLVEPLARREFGNTNYNILIQRAKEARELLDWMYTHDVLKPTREGQNG